MSPSRSIGQRLRDGLARGLRSWQLPAAVAAVLVLALAWWIAPRRFAAVISADGDERWREREAPPRREIVWQAPRPVSLGEPAESPAALISPRLTDGGATFYFTRRAAGQQADIYRARFRDGAWQTPEPVREWNTASDDIGPTFSADGQLAYFYSDRPGGQGGFDLYVAERSPNGWSAPVNLGPQVNSADHEYDPAPGPDDKLFFASNRREPGRTGVRRSARDEDEESGGLRHPAQGESAEDGDVSPPAQEVEKNWGTTVRAHPGLSQFDIYVTSRASGGTEWHVPQPIERINLPGSSEGAPFMAGVFLYFASDRPVTPRDRPLGRDESPNLDLYRARWNGQKFVNVENLGRQVNTPADETEPALSPEGYTLLFASSRDGTDAVYRSTAQEVYHDVAWDNSRLRALGTIWWQALLITLLFVVALAGFWYARGWVFEKASMARFMVASLLLHCLILALMGLMPLATIVIEVAREIRVADPASQLFDDNQHQSHEEGQEAYEKLADLQSTQSQALPDVFRQESEPLNVPEPTQAPLLNLPPQIVRNVSPDRVEYVPVQEPPRERVPLELARPQARPLEMAAVEAVPAEALPAEETPQERALNAETAAIARQTADLVRPTADMPLARSAPTRLRPSPTDLEPLETDAAPLPEPVPETAPAPRTRVMAAEPSEDAPKLEAVAAAAATTEQAPLTPADTTVARTTPAQAVLAKADDTLPATRLPAARPRPVEVAALEFGKAEAFVAKTVTRDIPRQPQAEAVVDASAPAPLATAGASLPAELSVTQTIMPAARGAEASPAAVTGPLPQVLQRPRRPLVDLPRELALADTSPVNAAAVKPAGPAPLPERPAPPVKTESVDLAEGAALAAAAPMKAETAAQPQSAAIQLARAGEDRPSALKPTAVPVTSAIPMRVPLDNADALRGAVTVLKAVPQTIQPPVVRGRAGADVPDALLPAQDLAAVTATKSAMETPAAGPAVELTRAVAAAPFSSPATPPELGGPHRRLDPRLLVGTLAPQRLDAPASFSPTASQLDRAPARAKLVSFAEDNVGMQAMFTLRQGATRREFIELFGGTETTEAAVSSGLAWLAAHQNEEGSWSLNKHEGSSVSDTAGTGFALLPFLAAGHTTQGGQYQANVTRGLKWLVAQQKPNGDLLSKQDNAGHHMYAHGVAAIALCEAYGMSQDPELKEPAQRAINFVVAAQHQPTGGWRYQPNTPGDTSVVGWQVMALKSGEMAGLTVPPIALDGAKRWLASVEGNKPTGGHFGYVAPSASTAMTAEGLLCLQFMGTPRNDPRMRAGAQYLLQNIPKAGVDTSYYWYYGTQVMYHMQGEFWQAWNTATRDMVVNSQVKAGPTAGTWNPTDNWEKSGGRIYTTSVRLLMLEVYYRHLPLYQQLDD